jgi:hypothetical protein
LILVLLLVLLHLNQFETLICYIYFILRSFYIFFVAFIWNFISHKSILFNFSSTWFNKIIIIIWILIKHLNILGIHNLLLWTNLIGIWYHLLRRWNRLPIFCILFFNLGITINKCSFIVYVILFHAVATVPLNWWFLSLEYFLSGCRVIKILFFKRDCCRKVSCLLI